MAASDPSPNDEYTTSVALSDRAADRHPLGELLVLALPTVAQMASYTVMQFTDTWMLSKLGIVEPTAAANASLFGFAITSIGFGTLWVVNTLVSQSFGRGDRRRCGQYLWQGIWFGLIYGLLMLPLLPLTEPLFAGFGHEPRLAHLESTYLWITLSFTAFRLMGAAMGQFLLAIDRPNRVLIAAAVGASVNIFANWLLIWGHWGFPEWGLAGAAWGTNTGSVVEMLLLACFVFEPKVRRMYHATDWRLRSERLLTLVRIGVPSGLQFVGDVLAWAVFGMLVMAVFGTTAMAANTFAMRFMSLSFMPAFGISAAVTALAGRYIGRGMPDVAAARTALGFRVAAVYMLACGVMFFVFRHQLMSIFTDDPEVLRWGAMLLVFVAVFQVFDAMYIVYSGALRGAGDTLVPAIVTATACWAMVVGLAYAVAKWMPWAGILGPWTVATAYGMLLGVYMLVRFKRGAWRSIRIDRDEPPARAFEPIVDQEQPEPAESKPSLRSGGAWEGPGVEVVGESRG